MAGTDQARPRGRQLGRVIPGLLAAVLLVDLALRWFQFWSYHYAPARIAVLSVVIAALTVLGATMGGELVFDYGFNVEMVGEAGTPRHVITGGHGLWRRRPTARLSCWPPHLDSQDETA